MARLRRWLSQGDQSHVVGGVQYSSGPAESLSLSLRNVEEAGRVPSSAAPSSKSLPVALLVVVFPYVLDA
jgi:hypothetical protein